MVRKATPKTGTSNGQPSANQLALPTAFKATELTLPKRMSFAAWSAMGPSLHAIAASGPWWYGDWFIAGEDRYGEEMAQAIPDVGLGLHTLQNYAWVCRAVAPDRRMEGLTFSHHAMVAKCSPEDQTRWLELAEQQGWSVEELRNAIKDDKKLTVVSEDEKSEAEAEDIDEIGGDELQQAKQTIKEMLKTVSLLTDMLDSLPESSYFRLLAEQRARILTDIQNVKRAIAASRPYSVCLNCHNEYDDCQVCQGRGWMNKQEYDAASKEIKDEAKSLPSGGRI